MAEQIRSMQIDLSMRDLGVERTTGQVMRSFRDMKSEMLSSTRIFNRTEKSTKSYNNQLRNLRTTQASLKNELKAAERAEAKMADRHGENSSQALKASASVAKLKEEIDYMGKEIDQTSAEMRQFNLEQERLAKANATPFGRMSQRLKEMGPQLRSVGNSMRGVGQSMSMYVTAPVIAGFAGAVKASIDYEQALAGVAKTTDLSGKELQKMSNEITHMSNTLPFASTEIAGVAEAAGQLGVKKSEITDFTKTMLDMSVATNLTSEEAATEFARFANAAGMPISDVDRLGSAVVALGNSTATTEKEIVEMAQRLAGAGAQAGFNADEIMSISAAMSSVGIEAEAGGTAMTQIFNKMTKASAEGGEELNNFAKVSGMSATEFAQTWENNPTKALSAFVKGLGNTEGGAKGVLKALDSVGIKGIREADTIRRMSNNHGILNKALKTGEKGWKDNSALSQEAETRYKTLGSQLKVLRNNFVNFGRSLGDTFGPALGWIAEKLSGLFKYLQTANPVLKGFVAIFGLIAASIGPVLIGLGALIASIGAIVSSATAMSIIGGIFSAITSPITGIVAGIVALGAAFVIAYKKSETFRNIVNGVINAVKGAFMGLFNVAKIAFNGIMQMWQGNFANGAQILNKILPPGLVNMIRNTILKIRTVVMQVVTAVKDFGLKIGAQIMAFWQANGPMIMQAVRNIGNTIKTVFQAIWSVVKPILTALGTAISWTFNTIIVPVVKTAMNIILGIMKFIWPVIKWLIVDTWNAIKGTIQGALNIIMGTIKVFSALFTGNWGAMWSGIKQVASGVLNMVWGLIQLIFIGKILKVVRLFGGLLKSILSGAWNVVKRIFSSSGNFIWGIVKRIFTSIKNFITNIFNGVKSITSKAWNFIYTKIAGFARSIFNSVRSRFNSLKNSTTSIFNSVRSFLYKLWSAVRNKVVSYAQSLWNGVRSRFNSLKNSIKSIFNSVRSFMYDIWTKIKNKVISLAKSLWNGVKDKFNSLKTGLSNIITKVKNNLVDTWDSIKNKVIDIASGLWSKVKSTFNNMKDGLEGIIGDIKGHITGMVDAVKKGLNGLIKGLNWVGSKLDLPKIPKLSTGTQKINRQVKTTGDGKLKNGTMAVVGDKGPGNGKGRDGRREMIRYPNGKMSLTPAKDTTTYLPKGSSVINGATTQSVLSTGTMPQLSTGTLDLPHFSLGSWAKDRWDDTKSAAKWTGDNISKGYKATKGAIGDGAKWLGSKVKDVMDYMENPGKLLDLALEAFNVDFSKFGTNDLVGEITTAAWKKMKKAATTWIKNGMEAMEATGDGGVLDMNKLTYKYGNDPNYYRETGVKWHSGLDFSYINEKLPSTINGTANVMPFNGGGYGNWVKIVKGAMEVIYAHLSKHTLKDGQKVKIGDTVGISGNTGFSTGPHLHYEMRKNGKAFDPLPWLKKNNGGGKGASYARNIIKQAQSILGGKYKNKAITEHMMALAKRESNYDPKAVNNWDINAMRGTPSKGMFQMIEPTFRSNAKKGHTNFNSSLDQAISSMRYIVKTYGWGGFGRAAARAYATGGIINTNGMYNLAEDGHSEVVVPLDPARASDAMKLITYAQSKIKDNNKRPNQVSNKYGKQPSNDDNTNLLLQMIANQQKQLDALMEIARSNKHIEGQPKGFNTDDVSNAFGRKARMQGFNYGM
ncbi:phage tail tape measure protein [Staphylococcus aureus]